MTHFDHRLSPLSRRILVRRSQDRTEEAAGRSALVIAPHPDDETFGCGALIMRKRAAGARVDICVVSDGGGYINDDYDHDELVAMRDRNLKRACERLGVPEANLHQLGFPDADLPAHVDQITARLREVLQQVQPDEVYIPSVFDEHRDHIAVYGACMKAIEGLDARTRVFTYPVWFWAWGSWHRFDSKVPTRILAALKLAYYTLRLRPRTVRTGEYREPKRDVFEFYRWELRDDYDFFEKWYLNEDELFFETQPGARTKA